MTVASLWKALDRAGCGRCVGAKELQDHHNLKATLNPWNIRRIEKHSKLPENRTALAVDLSIWICEALASSAMRHNHVADPAVQLVYSRALNLLNLGIKLVVVVEGKRRNRARKNANTNTKSDQGNDKNNNDACTSKKIEDTFRKRRSGTMFWTACERCEQMLKQLGIIVVRAKAEGEALCALLNQRGIVDGVISNDGDCLLFGAKVIYTKFSVENLNSSKVIRYDAEDIRAVVDDDDADRYDRTGLKSKEGEDVVELSRSDLIAFAILTGSDLAGEGISKVGCRKAIRFIRKCQIDNPLKLDGNSSPAIEQLLSWEQAATSSSVNPKKDTSIPRCSCCGHAGTKKDHLKYGCKGCGTEPGEPCFQLSPGGRFRKLLRSKALEMQSNFNPSMILKAYNEPNENQIPISLVGKTARSLNMNSPKLGNFLQLPLIIRGSTLKESRMFIKKSLSAYLARRELFEKMSTLTAEHQLTRLPKNKNPPVPVSIKKLLLRNGKPSCEVTWIIKATTSDTDGNPIDQYEFSTIEDDSVITKCYPELLKKFYEEQKKIQRQGTAEQEKRRSFLLNMEKSTDQIVEIPVDKTKKRQTRKDYFCQNEAIHKPHTKVRGVSDDVQAINIPKAKATVRVEKRDTDMHIGRVISIEKCAFGENCLKQHTSHNYTDKVLIGEIWGHKKIHDDSSTINSNDALGSDGGNKNSSFPNPKEDYSKDVLTPGHIYYSGIRSVFEFGSMADDTSNLSIVEFNAVRDASILSVTFNEENRCQAGRKVEVEKYDSKPLFKHVPAMYEHRSNGASSSDFNRIEQHQENCGVKNSNIKQSVEVLPTFEEQSCVALKETEIGLTHSPLPKRHKLEVIDKKTSRFDDFFCDDRVVFFNEDSRRSFIPDDNSIKQMYKSKEHTNDFDRAVLAHNLNNQRADKVVFDGRKSFSLSSKLNCAFNGYSQIGGRLNLRTFGDKRLDKSKGYYGVLDYESYASSGDIEDERGKRRRQHHHQQAMFRRRQLKKKQNTFGTECDNDVCKSSYFSYQRRRADICKNDVNHSPHDERRNSSNPVRVSEPRTPENQRKIHLFATTLSPEQCKDELLCYEGFHGQGNKIELDHDKHDMARPTPLNWLSPSESLYNSKDRSQSHESCGCRFLDERDDQQDEFFVSTIDQGIREEPIWDGCYVGERCDEHCQPSSNYKNAWDWNSNTDIIARDKLLEKRVAMKVDTLNRRAQIGRLCSKLIQEEHVDNSSTFRCPRMNL